MKCPACGYTSFPYLDRCRKCGQVLAEARAVYGVYALPPTTLDLMLAYEAPVDAAETASPEAVSTPTIDLGELLDGIELEVAESGDASPSLEQTGEPSDAAAAVRPTFDLDTEPGRDFPPAAPDAARPGAEDDLPAPTLDLSGLEDLSLELTEVAEDTHLSPLEQSISPTAPGEVERVFDLDEDEPESRPLDAEAEPSRRVGDGDEEDEDSEEYVLEIVDELALEIDELEFEDEADEEGEDGDDAKR
jgi:hypothetical protein